ncbi:MAG: hypothetical protein HQ478_13680 [Chloroflexi bacterium]|nr:hypothetical protein [Chloroflexota bacterium]
MLIGMRNWYRDRLIIAIAGTTAVVAALFITQAALGATTPAVTFGQTSIGLGTGGSTVIDIDVAGVPAGVDGIQVNIQHSSRFSVTNPLCAGIFTGAVLTAPVSVTGGTLIGCAFLAADISTGDGTAMTFQLNRLSSGDETIRMATTGSFATKFADDGSPINPALTNNVDVRSGFSLSGVLNLQVRSDAEAYGVAHVTIIPGGQTASIGADGSYTFSNIDPGTYSLFANAHGFLTNQIDGVAVSSGDVVVPQTTLRVGDVNGDGAVSILDISAVASNFGVGEPRAWTSGGAAPNTSIPIPGTATPAAGAATATATPTPAPVTPPTPQSGSGVALVAIQSVGDENGFNEAQSPDFLKNWGVTETMFLRNPATDATEPWIGQSWTLTGLTSATIDINTSAVFRWLNDFDVVETFGSVGAEDVAWSMNNANACVNSSSIHGQAGDFCGLWGAWSVVDADTVGFDFNFFDSTWASEFLNESGQALSIFSAQVLRDHSGTVDIGAGTVTGVTAATFARANIVGTGPYLVEEWFANDRASLVDAEVVGAAAHWKHNPSADRITFLQVPDPAIRSTLLSTGAVDVARLDLADLKQFTDGGFLTTGTGNDEQLGIFFAGNLWETASAVTGDPLDRPTLIHDLAWISKSQAEDAADFEEAKSIRNALARAYDREAINDSLLGSQGHRVDVMYVPSSHSRFNTAEWSYAYDPSLATQIIRGENSTWPVTGNYRKDQVTSEQQGLLNNNAFSVSLYAQGSGGGLGLGGDVTDAVAGYWADIGLQVFVMKMSYVTFRPTIVSRSNTHPWVTACDKGREGWPWHTPKGLVQTSLTRGGFSCGFEIPFILTNYLATTVEPDEATRNSLIDDYVDYVHDQALQPGIVAVPNLWGMNPNKVSSWDMGRSSSDDLGRAWNLVLN